MMVPDNHRYNEFITQLKERLQAPLPGRDAHMQMAPMREGQVPRNFKHAKPPKEGGVLLLLYPGLDGISLPLMQRPEYPGVHSGQISLPGGKKEPEDASLVQTALREAHEEVGVPPQTVEVIGALSSFYVAASNVNVLPVVAVAHQVPAFVPDPKEVVKIIEATTNHLTDTRYRKITDITVGNSFTMQSPYYDVGGHVVWGATAMMLSEFGAILSSIEAS